LSIQTSQHGTADICDLHSDEVQILPPEYWQFGGLSRCQGEISTIALNGNVASLKALLAEPGNGKIAVVEARADYCAVFGDRLATLAIANGWVGIVVNGYIRDSAALSQLSIGIWALGLCPRRSTMDAKSHRNVKLIAGTAEVCSGNFFYADEDGLVVAAAPFDDISFRSSHA
jgi:regulator of ribonuclease activity A